MRWARWTRLLKLQLQASPGGCIMMQLTEPYHDISYSASRWASWKSPVSRGNFAYAAGRFIVVIIIVSFCLIQRCYLMNIKRKKKKAKREERWRKRRANEQYKWNWQGQCCLCCATTHTLSLSRRKNISHFLALTLVMFKVLWIECRYQPHATPMHEGAIRTIGAM